MRHAIVLVVLIAGCAARSPEVTPIDNGRYTLTAQTPSQSSNAAATARRLAIQRAGRYCKDKHRDLYWESFDDGTTHTDYTSTITFTCR
jgi:hypothetical protein